MQEMEKEKAGQCQTTAPSIAELAAATYPNYSLLSFQANLPTASGFCSYLSCRGDRTGNPEGLCLGGAQAIYIHFYIYTYVCVYIYIHTDQNLQACMHKTYYIYVPWYSAIHILMDRHMKYIYIYIHSVSFEPDYMYRDVARLHAHGWERVCPYWVGHG